MSARTFEARPAIREAVPLLVGLFGPSGGGKTFSALRLASGIQAVVGGDIYGVDTEARRMLHYADRFRFQHVPFGAPFGSLDYLEVLKFCVARGAKVIIVDSMSHEHEGPGGLLDLHLKELDRMAGEDRAKRERVNILAWQRPKAARRALINGLLQLEANFVFCFRAKESAKPVRVNGKTEVVQQGFVPIAGDEFVFEQTANCLLLPAAGGVPTWKSEYIGERQAMKLPEQFRALFAESKPLDEDLGRQLAEWAHGGATSHAAPVSTDEDDFGENFSAKLSRCDAELGAEAEKGIAALKAAWVRLPDDIRAALDHALKRRHKPRAGQVDAERAQQQAVSA